MGDNLPWEMKVDGFQTAFRIGIYLNLLNKTSDQKVSKLDLSSLNI